MIRPHFLSAANWRWALVWALLAGGLTGRLGAAETVIISEFMAINTASKKSGSLPMVDEDKSYEDWVELQNIGTSAVNLGGWSLTDTRDNLRR